ncbi:ABC transporter substrate-binding protein [Phytoactinopolyspora alkaliphila]|uniref:ABC transporter substrate-binding protein n=1 Tax=Phytoactinopolyspora alkaliphila TaxID=1783498 RepID=A0A6N9YFX5_9ACTN|nr:ABC transporter substrate-binding protein [Phytoactinopolyspora alkaliphila]NED93874.1 ABC transporter substrate-binding protein [Phytoactinopolyspora alkaliphila]
MNRRMRLWRSLAVVGVASLVLAACGGDDAEEPGDDGGVTTEEPEGEGDEGGEEQPPAEGEFEPAEGDPAMTIGTLLPQSGSLSFLGPPMETGAAVAVEEINENGGIDGAPVELVNADEGDANLNIVGQSADSLINQGVDAILGAAATGMSQRVYSEITGAGILQISPSNTGVEVTDWETNGLYFRTAPSDVLQGEILGEVILEDGHETLGILYIDSPYGEGLAEAVASTVESAGVEVVVQTAVAENAESYSAEVAALAAESPDAIVVVSYDQVYSIIPELESAFDDLSGLYLVDGNTKDLSVGPTEDEPGLPEGVVEGATGTIPGQSVEGTPFAERLLEVTPDLDSWTYAGEAYDAIILVALSAIQAGSTESADIAAEMVDVSGTDGTECSTFAECKTLIESGESINYEGISGPIEFDENGDPQSAFIGIYDFDASNVPVYREARTLDIE